MPKLIRTFYRLALQKEKWCWGKACETNQAWTLETGMRRLLLPMEAIRRVGLGTKEIRKDETAAFASSCPFSSPDHSAAQIKRRGNVDAA